MVRRLGLETLLVRLVDLPCAHAQSFIESDGARFVAGIHSKARLREAAPAKLLKTVQQHEPCDSLPAPLRSDAEVRNPASASLDVGNEDPNRIGPGLRNEPEGRIDIGALQHHFAPLVERDRNMAPMLGEDILEKLVDQR